MKWTTKLSTRNNVDLMEKKKKLVTGNRKFGKDALKFARGITSRLIKQRNTRGKTASREAKKKKKNCKEKVTFEQLRRFKRQD